MSKREEIMNFITRKATIALAELAMEKPALTEMLRTNRYEFARKIGYAITEEYSFLELADIMEWKRQRVRR